MWHPPPLLADEPERLEALAVCGILDTAKDERFDRITRLAARIYDADIAFIGFIDAEHQWMKSRTSGEIPQAVPRRDSVCSLMLASRQPLVIGDMKTDPRLAGHPIITALDFRFYAGVPLVAEPDHVIGSLCILRREAATAEIDLTPLQDLGAVVVDEIALWKLNRELERRSEVDALTGLANRRRFDSALNEAVSRATRTARPLSMLLIDVDRFKALNDSDGHQAGDAVLRRIGEALSDTLPDPTDVVARYGGEEFAVVMPDTDAGEAQTTGEAIRRSLAAAALPHPLGGSVTASIGVSTHVGVDIDGTRLVREADEALYEAKRSGRDRVVAAGGGSERVTGR